MRYISIRNRNDEQKRVGSVGAVSALDGKYPAGVDALLSRYKYVIMLRLVEVLSYNYISTYTFLFFFLHPNWVEKFILDFVILR